MIRTNALAYLSEISAMKKKKAIDDLEYLFIVSIYKLFLAKVIKITGPYFTL